MMDSWIWWWEEFVDVGSTTLTSPDVEIVGVGVSGMALRAAHRYLRRSVAQGTTSTSPTRQAWTAPMTHCLPTGVETQPFELLRRFTPQSTPAVIRGDDRHPAAHPPEGCRRQAYTSGVPGGAVNDTRQRARAGQPSTRSSPSQLAANQSHAAGMRQTCFRWSRNKETDPSEAATASWTGEAGTVILVVSAALRDIQTPLEGQPAPRQAADQYSR